MVMIYAATLEEWRAQLWIDLEIIETDGNCHFLNISRILIYLKQDVYVDIHTNPQLQLLPVSTVVGSKQNNNNDA
jgi:hypothetical protein